MSGVDEEASPSRPASSGSRTHKRSATTPRKPRESATPRRQATPKATSAPPAAPPRASPSPSRRLTSSSTPRSETSEPGREQDAGEDAYSFRFSTKDTSQERVGSKEQRKIDLGLVLFSV